MCVCVRWSFFRYWYLLRTILKIFHSDWDRNGFGDHVAFYLVCLFVSIYICIVAFFLNRIIILTNKG